MGFSSNSTFAAGGGGGYSAVYLHTPLGVETIVLAGGGGGGGTRDGRPGGLAYVIGMNGEVPDVGHGGNPADEVSGSSSEEEIDLTTWMKKLEERKKLKASGAKGTDPFAIQNGDGEDSDEDGDGGTGSLPGSSAPTSAIGSRASSVAGRKKKKKRKGKKKRTGASSGAGGISSDSGSSNESDFDPATLIPGGRKMIDLRSTKAKLAEMKAAELDAAALRRSNLTADGDDQLRTGRNGGLRAAGKGGYKGGKDGAPLKGGDGAELFGAGGGGGMYGGGGGGCVPVSWW